MSRKKLVVIDGKSVLYRGYYAMTHLNNREGRPTGATYGFAMMALRILNELKPDYVVVAWDMSKTNTGSRCKLYEEYKSNRKPMPEDLREQIPDVRRLCEAFSWPFMEIDEYEADDIMGTLREQAKDKGIDVVLVTSDLDTLQLVNGHTSVLALKKGLSVTINYDEARLREEYDMTPQQFIDYKALRGDPSDNIPGVAGVGEKTARQLIADFGSLDGVYENLGKVKGAVRTKLENDREMAYLSRELVEIVCDLPIELDLEAAAVQDCEPSAIAELFSELNFRRLQGELPEWMRPQPGLFAEQPEKSDFSPVSIQRTDDNLSLEEAVVVTLDNLALVSSDKKRAFLVPVANVKVDRIIGYHVKEDIKRFDSEPEVSLDVMIAAFVLNPLLRQQELSALAADELGLNIVDLDRRDDANEEDMGSWVSALWLLHDKYNEQLNDSPKLKGVLDDIEWPILPVLARIEQRGMKLDIDYLDKMSQDFTERIQALEQDIYKEAGREFNINSPKQLQVVLFDELGLSSAGIKKTKSGYSTGASELDKLRSLHPIVDLISRYRELTKLKSTYIDALPKLVDENSRLHTTLTQTVAQTGRLSSLHPNLQNIPVRTEEGRAIRKAFTAEKGNVLVSADYSQFELRLAAHLSGDEHMLDTFSKGRDIHAQTAADLYGVELKDVSKEQRYNAKAVNFGVMYGMSAHGLSVSTEMSREEAADFIKKYFSLRPQLYEYLEGLKKQAHEQGYVETMFGRRRPMPDIRSSNYMVRAAAERAAMNMPIQGTEADIMKLAMIEADKRLDEDCWQIMQVHDSILVECPESKSGDVARLLKDAMESAAPEIDVDLVVDTSVGKTWQDV